MFMRIPKLTCLTGIALFFCAAATAQTLQQQIDQKSKAELEKESVYDKPIVTEITPFTNFYVAENYHKDYYDRNKDQPYCNFVIDPKIHKLLQQYGNEIKEEYN